MPVGGPAVNESFRSAKVINLSDQSLGAAPTTPVPAPALVAVSNSARASTQRSANRKIITNGDLRLQVADIDQSVTQIAKLAADFNGYVVKSEVSGEGNTRTGNIQIRIPSDQFQTAWDRLKTFGTKVARETLSGEDVSERYIDLKARLNSLQATAKRTQELLAMAKTADEALKVNIEMGRLQEQIESLMGQLQYIENRADFATFTVFLEMERPVPVPVEAWQPGATVERAFHFLVGLGRMIADVVIWSLIVGLPVLFVVWGSIQLVKRSRRYRSSVNQQLS